MSSRTIHNRKTEKQILSFSSEAIRRVNSHGRWDKTRIHTETI